jgi:hypothetical protein
MCESLTTVPHFVHTKFPEESSKSPGFEQPHPGQEFAIVDDSAIQAEKDRELLWERESGYVGFAFSTQGGWLVYWVQRVDDECGEEGLCSTIDD